MIRPYKGTWPKLAEGVYVDPSAQVIGDVELGEHASVWMNAVVRGDVHSIRIGPYTNVQDLSVIHVHHGTFSTQIGDHVTIGHSVTLHGCRIGSYCLIGMGAVILNGAQIGDECIVAAGTLVPEGMQVPPRRLLMGTPGRVRREVTAEEREGLRGYAESYVAYKNDYLAESGRW